MFDTATAEVTSVPSGAAIRAQPYGWTRPNWLAWRRHHLGASDVAALLGWSRFSTPMSLYLGKVGLLDDDDAGEAAEIGLVLESGLAELFKRRTGLHVIARQALVTHPDYPWLGCTLDGLAVESPTSTSADAIGTVQTKVSADFSWDVVPDEYVVQVQIEMGLTGFRTAFVPVLHAGRRFAVYTVDFDPAGFEALARAAHRFWYEHVAVGNPPPADGDENTTDALKNAYRYRAVDDTVVELDDDTLAVAREWRAAKAHAEAAATDLARVENQLRVALGTATIGTRDGDELVTWKPQRVAGRIDEQHLRDEWPDIAAACTKPDGKTRVLRPTKALKALAQEGTE